MNNMDESRISSVQRLNRAIVGLALITYIYFSSGTLGNYALLPIFAIYPLMLAALGSDPLYRWIRGRLFPLPAKTGKPSYRTTG